MDKIQNYNDISNDFTEVVVSPGDAKKLKRSQKIYKLFKINNEIIKKLPKVLKSNSMTGYVLQIILINYFFE